MFKPSGNPKVLELTKSVRERSYNLSCLQPIKLEELNAKGKPKRLCAWCNETELNHGNQKYCSSDCSQSATAWAYPQKEDALRYLLVRQDWKCIDCQFDYRPIMEAIVERDRKISGTAMPIDTLPWYYLKRLKNKVDWENKPEVDHVIPVAKGGDTLGLSNHACRCYRCHKKKSKIDNSGPRKKKD
ncbi:MAG TPA: HNH endonuclease signature motif containing protein [Rhabdochlamydiaceae bacterium]